MTVGEGLLLGIVQGITEFLPVSSSGHLVLARTVFTMGSVPLLFDVLLHVATLAVIVLHYRVRIWELIEVTFRYIRRRRRPEDTPQLRFIAVIIVATICTVAIALVLRKTPLAGDNPTMVSVLFLVTAALLASTRYLDRYIQPREGFYMHQALITGIAQGFGTLAGISRSGITITASLYSGMNREQSGEYAFILSIPAVLQVFVLHSVPVYSPLSCCFGWFGMPNCGISVYIWSLSGCLEFSLPYNTDKQEVEFSCEKFLCFSR